MFVRKLIFLIRVDTTLVILENECLIAGRSIFLFLEGFVTISLMFFFLVLRSQILECEATLDKQHFLSEYREKFVRSMA